MVSLHVKMCVTSYHRPMTDHYLNFSRCMDLNCLFFSVNIGCNDITVPCHVGEQSEFCGIMLLD